MPRKTVAAVLQRMKMEYAFSTLLQPAHPAGRGSEAISHIRHSTHHGELRLSADAEAMQRMLAEMRAEYRRVLPALIGEIEKSWLRLGAGAGHATELEDLQARVRAMAGAARSFGLPAVSEAASALEAAVGALITGGSVGPGEIQGLLGERVEALRRAAA